MKKYKLLLPVLAAILLLIPLVSACGGETTVTATTTATATATTTATTTATAPAKPEGTLTWGTASLESEGFLPWVTFLSSYIVFGPIYDALAYATPMGEKIPGLARSWEWNDDYTVLTLHLQEGVQFQDGWGELTSEDVKYMFEHTGSEESPFGLTSFFEFVTSIETPDPYTVVITQSEPNVNNADTFVFATVYGNVACKAYVESVGPEQANIHPIGSGPYKLVDRRTGDYVMYEAADEHWRVVPEYKYLIIKAVPEESTRVAMLITGDIDATQISEPSMADVEAQEDLTIDIWPYGCSTAVMFGGLVRPGTTYYEEGYHNTDPWADIRVREAMSIAIDREAINEALHYGLGYITAIVSPIPGEEDLPRIQYDPERARQLLAEAAADGVFTPNENGGFHFRFVSAPSHPGTPLAYKEGEAVAGYWADIGITCDIAPIDFPAYMPEQSINHNVGDCYTYRYVWGGYNPYTMLMQLNKEDIHWGGRMQCEISDIMTPMAQAALAEFDLEIRHEMYKEIAKVQYDGWCEIPLIRVPYLIAKNKSVGDWPPNTSSYYFNFEYVRYAQPLNTYRLFDLPLE
jgi:ABC-type transport system substrate-binding protein